MQLAILLTAFLSLGVQDKNATFVDEKSAGPDFQVQGEYTGEIPGKGKWGAQVIARGGGKFEAQLLEGGLPGDGWNKKTRLKAKGTTKISGDKWSAEIGDGKLKGKSAKGVVFTLKRIVRKSPTLEKKPPKGAIVLFDGKNVDAWKGGKIVEGNLLRMGTTSKKLFGNHTLHIEFRLCFKPYARGQGRANSGVYIGGRHEVQVLDSFALDGKHNECGGIYSVKPPDVNMCFPPLSWQTYDVEYRLATAKSPTRVTVRHNGVKIHDDVEIKKEKTTAAPAKGPSTEPGPIYLQNHRNPIVYRNIWVVPHKK